MLHREDPRRVLRSLLSLAVVLTAGASAAGTARASGGDPSLLTLDRMNEDSLLGIQVGFHKLDQVDLGDGFAMRFDLHGQYVLPSNAVGLYGQLPLSHLFISNAPDGTGIGNIEVGAFFMPFHRSNLILRAGLALGTASDSGTDAMANAITMWERLTDLLQGAPDYTTLRLSLSTIQQSSGLVFFRGDLGLDVALDRPSGADSVLLRANAAVGFAFPGVDLSFELVNLANPDAGGSTADKFTHTAAFHLGTRGPDQLHAGVVFPLDERARGDVWIISAGYQHAY